MTSDSISWPVRLILGVALLLAPTQQAEAQQRKVAIIVDTSGSMSSNDQPRFTVLASQLVADILDSGDRLMVLRLPAGQSSCEDGPTPSLAMEFPGPSRSSFKGGLDSFLGYSGGNAFAAPVNTALKYLGNDASVSRLLLFVADADGFGSECKARHEANLAQLQRSGGIVAAVNLRSSGGEFRGNPPFSYAAYARTSGEVLLRLAEVYQRVLGSRKVQSGKVGGGKVKVTIAPYVKQAFLVVASEGDVGHLKSTGGNPGAAGIEGNYRGGGQVKGTDGRTRSYRIVRLDKPKQGRWTFQASGLQRGAGYMLLQEFSLRPRMITKTFTSGGDATIEVEIIDENTGKRVKDPSRVPGLSVTLKVDGENLTFKDDGAGGDAKAGDGVLTARHRFRGKGRKVLPVRIRTGSHDLTTPLTADVQEADWFLKPRPPTRPVAGTPVLLVVQAMSGSGGSKPSSPPDHLKLGGAAPAVTLRDDGKAGDKKAGDKLYSGTWVPAAMGDMDLPISAVGGGTVLAASMKLTVYGRTLRPNLVSPTGYTVGSAGNIEVDLLDADSGKRVADLSKLSGLSVTVNVEGRNLILQDGGADGDRAAGDGTLTARHTFSSPGKKTLKIKVSSQVSQEVIVPVDVTVIRTDWILFPQVPAKAVVEKAAKVAVKVEVSPGQLNSPPRPTAIQVGGAGGSLVLRDDGRHGDTRAGDGIYAHTWTPRSIGRARLTLDARGGGVVLQAAATVEVIGVLELGLPRAIQLGEVESEAQSKGKLDLSGGKVRGKYKVSVSSSFDSPGAALELDVGGSWVLLGRGPVFISLRDGGPRTWPVRVRVGECPAGFRSGSQGSVVLESIGPEGKPVRHEVPLALVVVKDPWLSCYWYIPATILASALLLFLIYGYIWPHAFSRRSGVVISSEEDMNEGYFHPIRRARGTRRKFYRHATAYICADYRISGKPRGAVVRLRAARRGITMEPMQGVTLERRNLEDEWEPLEPRATRARSGVVFRHESGNLYFEFRTRG